MDEAISVIQWVVLLTNVVLFVLSMFGLIVTHWLFRQVAKESRQIAEELKK